MNTSFTRQNTIRVKTSKGRKVGSTRWLQRQLNDPFVQQAHSEGYRSRAIYKLMELDKEFKLFKPKQKILDLGAAPGSWSEYAASKGTYITGLDLLPIEPLAGATFLQGDFTAPDISARLIEASGTDVFDVILSDMAPNTSGHAATDHLRIMTLCEEVFYFAREHLRKDGKLVVKIFQGGAAAELLKLIKQDFAKVKHVKPSASRKESTEMYLVATGFRK